MSQEGISVTVIVNRGAESEEPIVVEVPSTAAQVEEPVTRQLPAAKGSYIRTSFDLPKDLLTEFKVIAIQQDRTMRDIVEDLIRGHVEKHED